jgi:hypothetical protein
MKEEGKVWVWRTELVDRGREGCPCRLVSLVMGRGEQWAGSLGREVLSHIQQALTESQTSYRELGGDGSVSLFTRSSRSSKEARTWPSTWEGTKSVVGIVGRLGRAEKPGGNSSFQWNCFPKYGRWERLDRPRESASSANTKIKVTGVQGAQPYVLSAGQVSGTWGRAKLSNLLKNEKKSKEIVCSGLVLGKFMKFSTHSLKDLNWPPLALRPALKKNQGSLTKVTMTKQRTVL